MERQAQPAPPGRQEHPRRDRAFLEQEPRGGVGSTALLAGVPSPWRCSRPRALNEVFQQLLR